MNRRKKYFFIALFLILIGGAVFAGFRLGSSHKAAQTVAPDKKEAQVSPPEDFSEKESLASTPPAETEPEVLQTSSTSQTYQAWDKTSIYNGGDMVSYKGKIYKASWWTQGEYPDKSGQWGVWKAAGTVPKKNTSKNQTVKKETQSSPAKTTKSDIKNFRIVGYFPDWSAQKASKIQYGKLTHINYAFAIPKKDGTLRPFENPQTAKQIIKKGHQSKVKVLIAVGGWSYNDNPLEPVFMSATSSEAKCKKFAANILKIVDQYGFDGVDMDWEHPRVDGKSKSQYQKLMKYLRQGLTKRKKLLTSAVLAGVSADGNVLWDAAAHSKTVIGYVDWLNVMAYDGGDGNRHSPYSFAVNSANYWLKTRKVPKKKVVLGVPFYARPSWASYADLIASNPSASSKDKITYNGMLAYYNGLSTMKKKTEWALKNAGGIMIWELSQDTDKQGKSLLNQIYKTAKKK